MSKKKPKLTDILIDLVAGHNESDHVELSGGLHLQFRQATAKQPVDRLCCYRIGKQPSSQELDTVEDLLAKVTSPPSKDREFVYTGSDGQKRYCHVFKWQSDQPSKQMGLPLAGETGPRPNNYEES